MYPLVKPVRLSSSKYQGLSCFGSKLESNVSNRVLFNHQQLFDWSNSWSRQVQLYSFPAYKLTRGAFIRKPGSSFWANHAATSQYNTLTWQVSNVDKAVQLAQPTKQQSQEVTIVMPTIPKVNNLLGLKLFSKVLDEESTFFHRNWLLTLHKPHEEFDINFIYQFWTSEINTSRRGDHATRYKTNWSSLDNKLLTNITNITPIVNTVALNYYLPFETSTFSTVPYLYQSSNANRTSVSSVSTLNELTKLLTSSASTIVESVFANLSGQWHVTPTLAMNRSLDTTGAWQHTTNAQNPLFTTSSKHANAAT